MALTAPRNVSATRSGPRLLVAWSAVAGAEAYVVSRARKDSLSFFPLETGCCPTRYEDFAVPDLRDCIVRYEQVAALTQPASRVIGVSLNTQGLSDAAARQVCQETSEASGLPCVDPVRHDLDTMLAALP